MRCSVACRPTSSTSSYPGRDGTPDVGTRDDDRSIEIHACHGPLREVEVLHDRLLALFDAASRPDAVRTSSS